MSEPSRRALITGASSGIGEAYARLLASRGFDLVVTARRADRLAMLAQTLRSQHGVDVLELPMDIARPEGARDLIGAVTDRDLSIDYLVSNAGYALDQDFLEAPWSRHDAFLDILLEGVVELSHAFMPGMIERGWGRVVNVASVASFLHLTPSSLYGPAKAFVLAFSRSMHASLHDTGVHMTALCPGYTRTEFFRNIGVEEKVFRLPRFMLLDVDRVVRDADRAVSRNRAVCIPGLFYRVLVAGSRFLPLSVFASRRFRSTLPTPR
ncbi:MAG: dehydrogenase [Phycisphaerae bacterium]|nr:dehydrogenase [Phycisphaerae bacterium]HBZ96364.1 dehydrogenase [Phycisphaerales bacterium]